MGSWNHTFWDNDSCLSVLHLFFVHLGLIPSDKPNIFAMRQFPGMGPLFLRTKFEVAVRLQTLLYSISKETVEFALQKAPDFVAKLEEDMTTLYGSRGDLELTGISFNTFWVLLRMHVGMPVEPVTALDDAAKEFAQRRICPPQDMFERNAAGQGWNLGQYLETFIIPRAPWTPSRVEKQRNKDAKIIQEGILRYKEMMIRSSSCDDGLKPMRLPFLGILESARMWAGVSMTTASLPLDNLWNVDLDATTGVTHDLDPTINVPHCSTCHTTEAELLASAGRPLKKCPCGFALYCDAHCQKKSWRGHRLLHEIRMEDVEAARRKQQERFRSEGRA